MTFWQKVGGRKAFNGYVASALLTGMAFFLDASFEAYGAAILLSLGITSGLTAAEDVLRYKRED